MDNAIYDKLKEHGTGPRALGIPDDDVHRRRLELAARMLREEFGTPHVLDIGCGFGDLKPLLGERFCYYGIDPHAHMIAEAVRRHGPGHAFSRLSLLQLADSTPPDFQGYDVTVALGVLVTVPAFELPVFLSAMRRLTKNVAVLSFIDATTEYDGVFNKHAVEKIMAAARWYIDDVGETDGETTIKLRVF